MPPCVFLCVCRCVFYITEEVRLIRSRVCLWDNGKLGEKGARQTVAAIASKIFFIVVMNHVVQVLLLWKMKSSPNWQLTSAGRSTYCSIYQMIAFCNDILKKCGYF